MDIESIIEGMLSQIGESVGDLQKKGEVTAADGTQISWKYLSYVRQNTVNWQVRTAVLFSGNDTFTSFDAIDKFINSHDAVLTVMHGGEHWFHTKEQMEFLGEWLTGEIEN